MQKLYKVRNINISLQNKTTFEPFLDIPCEFGMIMEKEGILFIETYLFNKESSDKVLKYDVVGCPASISMSSFGGIEIDAPNMVFTGWTTKENKLTFRCLEYITVNEEDAFYAFKKSEEPEMAASQLLRIDLWGLDLLITPNFSTTLIVSDAPFEMELCSDDENGCTFIQFHLNKDVVHNTNQRKNRCI